MEKRIVILTQYFPPEMGAPQSRLFETAIGLKNNGWEVIVITALPNYPTGKIYSQYKKRIFTKETLNEIYERFLGWCDKLGIEKVNIESIAAPK